MTSIFKHWNRDSILITDAGWGDSGKGKVVSSFTPQIGVKVIGGHNAGHTVVTDKGELGLGLIPSSVIYPESLNVIGQEVVINPRFLINEIANVKKFKIHLTPKNLLIDPRSHLIMPWHEIRDALSEAARGKAAVGSLHLGVGWTYSDRINRRGLRLGDLFTWNWKERVKKELQNQQIVINDMGRIVKRKIRIDESECLAVAREARSLRSYCKNTVEIIWKAIDGHARILFEDSHGAMLDISHGSWPFTTGVNTGIGGVYRSFGGKAVKSIAKTIVVTKAYQTRVGGGPMPTEDFKKFADYVRRRGGEIGTRSGRPRRCGAIDIPLLNYGYNVLGLGINDEIAITKLDVLTGLEKIPVCISYINQKRTYKISPNADAEFLGNNKANLIYLKGWSEPIIDARKFKDLPKEARNYIIFLQKHIKPKINFIGIGKHKDAKIII